MIELTDLQKEILVTDGNMLVKGGPGSGKTTVAILKAAKIIDSSLEAGQKVLFLSFARATVSRILQAITVAEEISVEDKRLIDVETYHAFFWRLITAHGYLLGLPRRLRVLSPHSEAVALSYIRNEYSGKLSHYQRTEKKRRETSEKLRIANEDGLVCFDLFAKLAALLLSRSSKICRLVENSFPTIILDEFQDTSDDQWRVIKALGQYCELVALADPEQRIFDFIGAHPDRLQHFEDEFRLKKFDLSDVNHRSKGTHLTQLGNDVLIGKFTRQNYDGFQYVRFGSNPNQAYTRLIIETIKALKRLLSNGRENWTLAILVPTKRMTRMVSDFLNNPSGRFTKINHHTVVDQEATMLAAEVIAYALQHQNRQFATAEFIHLMCSYYRGRGGDGPSKSNLTEASRIQIAFEKAQERRLANKEVAKNSVFLSIEESCNSLMGKELSGNPNRDWKMVRSHFAEGSCSRLQYIASEVRNIRLLDRGTQLREALSQDWLESGRYSNALSIVRQAFIKEHFATSMKPEKGVVVMNMHKAKGKQFDEVIIFEGWPQFKKNRIVSNPNRIVWENLRQNINDQTRHILRVSITRAKQRTTLLTPERDPCVLLDQNT